MLPTRLFPFLCYILKPFRFHVGYMLLSALFWSVYNAVSPYLLKMIIDKVALLAGQWDAIVAAVLPLCAVYMAYWVMIAINFRVRDWVLLRFFPVLRKNIVETMFGYLNRHSYEFFQNNFAGSLTNKISDMSGGTIAILKHAEEAFSYIAAVFIAIIMMFIVHPIFGAILFGWAAAFLGISLYYTRTIRHLALVFATSKTTLVGKIVDVITNTVTLRLFARHQYENRYVGNYVDEMVKYESRMQRYILKMRIGWDITIMLLIGLMLGALLYLYGKGQTTIGDFTFILTLSISIFHSMWNLASQFVDFSEEWGNCEQALTLLSVPHAIVDAPDAQILKVTKGQITFDDVTFRYQRNNALFANKNVSIAPGSKVGLVGFSGSGKTTFVHLILRFFEVASGRVLIDGQDIAKVTQDSLHEAIAMIPQDTSLFHRSLLENIRYGRLDATDEEVMEASQKARCHEFIQHIPEGYNALVGERGIKLSGGQRQRIAIARAMLKNAPILILDEATSALDSVTEKLIQEGLRELMVGRTTIVIAHRLSTLAEMDRILVFDKGQIIEDGTHEELLAQGGHYAKLWQMQAGGFLPEVE